MLLILIAWLIIVIIFRMSKVGIRMRGKRKGIPSYFWDWSSGINSTVVLKCRMGRAGWERL